MENNTEKTNKDCFKTKALKNLMTDVLDMRLDIEEIVSDFTEKINAIEREQMDRVNRAYAFLRKEKETLKCTDPSNIYGYGKLLHFVGEMENIEDIEDYETELRAMKEIRRWEKRFGLKELIKSLQEALEFEIEIEEEK